MKRKTKDNDWGYWVYDDKCGFLGWFLWIILEIVAAGIMVAGIIIGIIAIVGLLAR